MLNITSLFVILSGFFVSNASFELGLWRGSTHYFIRNQNNQFDFNKPLITTYNYSNNLKKNFNNNDYFYYNKHNLKIKLASIDKNGGVIIYANNNNNKTYINNQINFYNNLARSIININYSYNNEKKLKLNFISVSNLKCNSVKNSNLIIKNYNISNLIDILKTWNYCKTTTVETYNIFNKVINEGNSFDYEYLLNKSGYISKIFINNLVVSVPDIIDDNKPFSFLFGYILSNDCYKQVNLNYNFNGYLISTEFNEYEPFNFSKKIDNFLNLFKLKLKTLKNKTISFHNKVVLSHHLIP